MTAKRVFDDRAHVLAPPGQGRRQRGQPQVGLPQQALRGAAAERVAAAKVRGEINFI